MLCVTNMLLHGIEDPSFVRHDNTLARPYISYGQNDRVDIVLTNPPFGGTEEDGIETNFPKHFQTRETADLFLALIIRLLKPGGRAAVVLPDGTLFGEGVKTRLKEHLLEECNLHTIVRLPNSVFKPYASIGTNLLFFEKGEPTKEIWFYEHRVPQGQKAYSMTKPIRVEHLQACVDWWGGAERKGRQETEVAWKVSRRRDQGARLQPRLQEPPHRRRRPRRPGGTAGQAGRGRTADRHPARSAQGHSGGGAAAMSNELVFYSELLGEIKSRIRQAQVKAILAANAEMMLIVLGCRQGSIHTRQQQEGWGTGVIPRLSRDIRNELPELKGFSERNIGYMIRFAREYDTSIILQQPSNT